MKSTRIRLRLLLLLGLLLTAGSYRAQAQQFGVPHRPLGSESEESEKKRFNYGSLSILPVALFDIGGQYGGGNAGTQTLLGGLIDGEFGLEDVTPSSRRRGRYTIGGWYWGRSGNDLYEVHVRAQAPKGLGLQVGYLNTTQGFVARPGPAGQTRATDAQAVDLFVFYGFSSYSVAKNAEDRKALSKRTKGNWSVEIGAGLYIDMSLHYLQAQQTYSSNSTANYTFYASGSIQLYRSLSLQATEWVLRDRLQELNRITVGLGYSF